MYAAEPHEICHIGDSEKSFDEFIEYTKYFHSYIWYQIYQQI